MTRTPVLTASPSTSPGSPSLANWKRFIDALAASRSAAAMRAVLGRGRFVHETGLVHGDQRRIGLGRAHLLPFAG